VSSSRISVGLQIGTQPPLSAVRAVLLPARAMRREALHGIGLRLSARGLMTFSGKHFGFDGTMTWQHLR
jgi:hypothetical protein